MTKTAQNLSAGGSLWLLSKVTLRQRTKKMRSFRRTAFVCAFLSAVLTGTALAQDTKVTLLGTGSPPPVMNRFGPSILIEAGDKKFLFDAGRGAMQRLVQTKTRWQDVDGVFFTHLHSDHVVGFADLWLTGWLVAS